jgi:excisionase family DNA binding protein
MAGGRAGWSMFAAHPWSLINDHRAAPETRFHGQSRVRVRRGVPGSAASRLRRVLCMDERNVRGQQQEGRTACKREASQAPESRRERGRPVGTPNRPRATPEGWPPLLTASEVAVVLRTSRKAVYAMAERAQLPGVTRIGRRLLVRRDDLLSWLDERRAASPGGTRR